MNAKNPNLRDQADAGAREWFVRLLDDNVTAEVIVEWEKWLSNAGNREAYDKVVRAWGVADEAKIRRPTIREVAKDSYNPSQMSILHWRKSIKRGPGQRLIWAMVATAAVFVCAVGVAIQLFLLAPSVLRDFETGHAQRLDASLPDGSLIQIGAMTRIKVAYDYNRRSIDLGSGEAMFKVAHERSRPFVVKTRLGSFRAVGTAFNIDANANNAVLSVTEGVVSVEPAALDASSGRPTGSTMRVYVGQQLFLSADGFRLSKMSPGAHLQPAWLEGRLEYRAEPLAFVIWNVNRYASHPVVIADPVIAGLLYTGSINLTETDAWAQGLSAVYPIKVEKQNDGRIIIRENNLSN